MNNKNNDIFSGKLGLEAVIVMIGIAILDVKLVPMALWWLVPNQEIINQPGIRGSILKSIITVKNNTE